MVLSDAGNEVRMWARRQEICDAINERHVNADYMPDLELSPAISASHDPAWVLDGAEMVVLAVPSQTLRANLEEWVPSLPPAVPLVSLMKGVELGTQMRMSEVIAEVANVGPQRIGVVSGPNLAREIAQRQPAASVVACADEQVAQRLQQMCHTPAFRPYTNTDVVGCELGGTTKNVIALAVGMAVGLGYGDNTTATAITRGLAETGRLAHAMGADPMTLAGLAGLGDLVATCSSPLSRNRTFGEKLGSGMTVDEVAASTRQVAEGVKSCQAVADLARKHDVEMPIVEGVAALIRGDVEPQELIEALVSRSAKPERG
jgi:glycerol-3-phosphate dehydrogenase (NAD(P)+)